MTTRSRSLLPLVLGGCAIVLCTTACSYAGATYDAAPPAPAPGQENAANSAAPALTAIRTFDIGQIVVDGRGFTLYRSDKDTASPPKANCVGKCAQDWPPMTTVEGLKVSGINQALVGSVTRPDGVEQVTLAGWPVYSHTADGMPGETSGQGAGGTWFPIAPNGAKVQPVTTPPASGEFGL
jgi:predicted lipoprotein with Yx(FWY)xxD motif